MTSRPQVIWQPAGEEPSEHAFDEAAHYPSLLEAVEAALLPRAGYDPWLRQDGRIFDRRGILSIRDGAPACRTSPTPIAEASRRPDVIGGDPQEFVGGRPI